MRAKTLLVACKVVYIVSNNLLVKKVGELFRQCTQHIDRLQSRLPKHEKSQQSHPTANSAIHYPVALLPLQVLEVAPEDKIERLD